MTWNIVTQLVFCKKNNYFLQDTPTETTKTNCSWLSDPFNVTDYTGKVTFTYNGSCCSNVAAEMLKNSSYQTDIDKIGNMLEKMSGWKPSESNKLNEMSNNITALKQNALVKMLYCIPEACPGMDLVWDDCSGRFYGFSFLRSSKFFR